MEEDQASATYTNCQSTQCC